MTDREKVISHFQDAIEASGAGNRWWLFVRVDMIEDAIALLQEQEPLKPFYCEPDDSWGCRNCGETVGYGEFNPGGIDPVRNKYCPECGRKVKWDD